MFSLLSDAVPRSMKGLVLHYLPRCHCFLPPHCVTFEKVKLGQGLCVKNRVMSHAFPCSIACQFPSAPQDVSMLTKMAQFWCLLFGQNAAGQISTIENAHEGRAFSPFRVMYARLTALGARYKLRSRSVKVVDTGTSARGTSAPACQIKLSKERSRVRSRTCR